MKNIITIMVLAILTTQSLGQTKSTSKLEKKKISKQEMVSFTIVNENNSQKNVSFEWPFPPGPAPVGGTQALLKKVNKILSDNDITCPPKRKKISSNIWLCGNGKKIKTSNSKLIDLFTEAWDENE